MAVLRTTLLIVLVAVSGTGCITGRAATPAERPALDVPPPPSRNIPQLPAPDQPQPIEPVEEISATAKPSTPPRPRPQARDPKDATKPDPKTETPPPTEPPVQQPPQPVTPPLRMPQTGDATAAARQITDIIERTRRTLNGIHYQGLTPERRKAYEDAKLFAQQAEDALKASNLVFARELADKAERLARELQK